MFELTCNGFAYTALLEGRRRAHILTRTVGAPSPGDPLRVVEVEDGERTGRACFARVTYVEAIDAGAFGPVIVVSVDVQMSTDRLPALRDISPELDR